MKARNVMKASSSLLAAVAGAAVVAAIGALPGTGYYGIPVRLASVSSWPAPQAPALPPPPGPSGSVDGIDVTIARADSAPLRPGGDPTRFSVTVSNTTPADIADVGVVVYLGHCGCGHPGALMMPAGSMSMLDPVTGQWVSARYVHAGTGMDFLGEPLVPPFALTQGQTITYQLQMQLNADPSVTAGDSAIEVAITTPARAGYAASLPISVVPQT